MAPVTLVEIERKRALDAEGAERLTERLAASGFTSEGRVREVDTYYSRPDVDFLETVECLRVRRSEGRCEITYKPASDGATHTADGTIAKQETNLALADADQGENAHRLLDALGMVHLATVDKSRTLYRRGTDTELSVVVDTVAGLGTFAETEIVSALPRAEALARLDGTERLLALHEHPTVALPYRDLVLGG